MNDENGKAENLFNPLHNLLFKISDRDIQASINDIEIKLYSIEENIWDTNLEEAIIYFQPVLDDLSQAKLTLSEKQDQAISGIFENEDWQDSEINERTALLTKAILKLDEASSRLIKIKQIIEKLNARRREEKSANTPPSRNPKFKLNLSVKEAAAFFSLMKDAKLIEIPKRQLPKFARAFTGIFYTKDMSEDEPNSPGSFRSKFLTCEDDTLSNCHSLFSNLSQEAHKKMLENRSKKKKEEKIARK